MHNILSNNAISDNYEQRIQVEKLTPIGRAIIENYKKVRLDPKTIILVKKENFDLSEMINVSQNGKEKKKRRK